MADFLKRTPIGAPGCFSNNFAASTFVLNQSTDQWEVIFPSLTTDPITHVGFRNGGLNGTGTTWKASLQGVSGTNGNPDGTIKGGGSPASKTFTNASLTANDWIWLALDNSYTPATRGEPLALVVAYDSGTTPAGGTADLTIVTTGIWQALSSYPYFIANDNGGRAKSGNYPVYGYKTASAVFGQPYSSVYSQAVSSSTNPNEIGFSFTMPATLQASQQVVGVRLVVTAPAAGTNSSILRLYSGTTVLQDMTWDSEVIASTNPRPPTLIFDEAVLSTLTAGNTFSVVLAPQTTSNVTLHGLTMPSAADWDAYPGGQLFPLVTRNGGSFTTDPTTRLFAELLLADWAVAAAGGPTYFAF